MDILKTSPAGVRGSKVAEQICVLKTPCVGLSASHGTVALTHVLTVPVPRELSSSKRRHRGNVSSSVG